MTAAASEPGLVPEWTFGDRLRKIRRTLGVDQRSFAEQLGENPKTYAAWELDNTTPRDQVAVAKRIELFAGVPAAWTLAINTPPSDGHPAPRTATDPFRTTSPADTHHYAQVIELPICSETTPSRNGSPASDPGHAPATVARTDADRVEHHACAA